MRAELIEADDPRWTAILDRAVHDSYHLAEWAKAHEHMEGGTARALLVEGGAQQLMLPLIVRSIEGDLWDACSPYGYGGPILSRDASPVFMHEALMAGIAHLAELGCVSTFVRLHPFLHGGFDRSFRTAGTVVEHGPLVLLPLERTEQEVWKATRSGHRNEINRSRRFGMVVKHDTELRYLPEFARLYAETMRRLNASDYYRIAVGDIHRLAALLGSRLALWVGLDDGSVVSAAIFINSASAGLSNYHLSARGDGASVAYVSKAIIHSARIWARDAGLSYMNLGGGLGSSEDSLYRYKTGFGGESAPFRTWRVVVRPSEYMDICSRAGYDSGEGQGFFPAYRERQRM